MSQDLDRNGQQYSAAQNRVHFCVEMSHTTCIWVSCECVNNLLCLLCIWQCVVDDGGARRLFRTYVERLRLLLEVRITLCWWNARYLHYT